MRVKGLAQEHNAVARSVLKPGPLDLESSALLSRWGTTPPSRLDRFTKISYHGAQLARWSSAIILKQ